MKKLILILLALVVAGVPAMAQAPAAPTGQKTLAATIGVYVFPSKGQNASQQSKDESECYSWAVQNTGTDPFELAKQNEAAQQQAAQTQQQAAQAGQGAGAAGAVKGAAAGALIGEIASDDAGKGAAYGAAAGLIAGRRKKEKAQAQATKQVEQQGAQAQAATQEQLTNFKKAFGVCMQAKNYMVQY